MSAMAIDADGRDAGGRFPYAVAQPAFSGLDHVIVSLVDAFCQVGNRNAVEVVVDDLVEPAPHLHGTARSHAIAGRFVFVEAGNLGKPALGQAQDLAYGVQRRVARQAISAALAA